MPETFSTLEREMDVGRMYSSRRGRTILLSGAPADPADSPAAPKFFRFPLSSDGIPAPVRVAQGAQGSAYMTLQADGSYAVTGTLTGLGPITDPSVKPTLWLICDLTVPTDLAPADRDLLPRGADSTGNEPGAVFTLDGNAPTYAAGANTLSIAISPGSFAPGPDGSWQLQGAVDAGTNQGYHPMVVLGPSTVPDMNQPLPSGTVARLLTDLFMRPATIHPELNPRTQYLQRLAAIGNELRESGFHSYLDGSRFTRAAVTLEGIVRATPRLMPTRETCLAIASSRTTE